MSQLGNSESSREVSLAIQTAKSGDGRPLVVLLMGNRERFAETFSHLHQPGYRPPEEVVMGLLSPDDAMDVARHLILCSSGAVWREQLYQFLMRGKDASYHLEATAFVNCFTDWQTQQAEESKRAPGQEATFGRATAPPPQN